MIFVCPTALETRGPTTSSKLRNFKKRARKAKRKLKPNICMMYVYIRAIHSVWQKPLISSKAPVEFKQCQPSSHNLPQKSHKLHYDRARSCSDPHIMLLPFAVDYLVDLQDTLDIYANALWSCWKAIHSCFLCRRYDTRSCRSTKTRVLFKKLLIDSGRSDLVRFALQSIWHTIYLPRHVLYLPNFIIIVLGAILYVLLCSRYDSLSCRSTKTPVIYIYIYTSLHYDHVEVTKISKRHSSNIKRQTQKQPLRDGFNKQHRDKPSISLRRSNSLNRRLPPWWPLATWPYCPTTSPQSLEIETSAQGSRWMPEPIWQNTECTSMRQTTAIRRAGSALHCLCGHC